MAIIQLRNLGTFIFLHNKPKTSFQHQIFIRFHGLKPTFSLPLK